MKPDSSYLNQLQDEDKIFISRLYDMMESCREKYNARYTHFLDSRQQMLALLFLNREHFDSFIFYGGYDQSERCVLGLYSEYIEKSIDDFPIIAVSFNYRKEDILSHRDFLGALMSRQIKREMIGDIIINDGITIAFVYNTISSIIILETQKVGSIGVNVSEITNPKIQKNENFSEITGTVSSLRLDSIISLAARLSREKAAQLIKNTGIDINYENKKTVDFLLKEGDKFSVRGYGKFILFSVNGITKKDRIHICIKKYL